MAIDVADVLFILIPLVIILIGCEFFTNGIEWLGVKLGLAESCVGSVLAAVGTALPETIIPIVAIIFAANGVGHGIAIGAIIGAPFMLATLAMFLGGFTILIASRKKRRAPRLSVSAEHLGRDVRHFLIVYILAVLAAIMFSGSEEPARFARYAIAIILVLFYSMYLKKMFSEESANCENPAVLYFCKPFSTLKGKTPSLPFVVLQVLASLGLIIIGARIFVSDIEYIAAEIGLSEILLAFLIAPVATELPEKFNSILWYWRGKDTLALGNVTGAMVFQGSLPVSIGLVFTEWEMDYIHIASMVFAIIAISLIYFEMSRRGSISYRTLLFSGTFYFIYLVLILYGSSHGWI